MAIAEKTSLRLTSSTDGSGATTLTFTYPLFFPDAGDLVVFGLSWRSDATVTGVPHSVALATNGGNGSGIDSAIYWKIADGTEGSTWTFTMSASVKIAGVTSTWTDIRATDTVDATNNNTGTGTAGSTGTTGTLTLADQLVVCLFSNINVSTWSNFNNSQVEIGQIASAGQGTASRNNTALTAVIVSSTAAADYTADLSASQTWSTAVATFKSVVVDTGAFFLVF